MGIIEFFYLVAGLLAGLAATAGYGVMSLTPADFTIARRCFWAASLLFAGIGIVWGITTPESVWVIRRDWLKSTTPRRCLACVASAMS
jgi:hypothetical protein